MGGDLSDDDSIHLHTPQKGHGRCCAGRLCAHSHSRYFVSGLCSDCHGYAHDKDCAQMGYDGMWLPGKPLVCMLCVHKNLVNSVKAKEREKRKIKEADRKVKCQKVSDARDIHQQMTPFNYHEMQKILRDKKLTNYLVNDRKKKAKSKK